MTKVGAGWRYFEISLITHQCVCCGYVCVSVSLCLFQLSLYNYINGLSIYLIARPHEYLHDNASPRPNGNRPILLSTRNSFSSCLFLFLRFFLSSRPVKWMRTSLLCENSKRFSHVCPGHFYTRPHHNYLVCICGRFIYNSWLLFWLIFYVSVFGRWSLPGWHKESRWKGRKKYTNRETFRQYKMHKFKYEMQSQTHQHPHTLKSWNGY